MARVVHCKREPYDVYIGRPSKWGNPYKIKDFECRERCIDLYKQWLLTNEKLMSQIGELKGKTLGCWCAPLACHGDVLAKLAEATKRSG